MTKQMLSVIIPVYNVEKYVQKCIESVINQTLDNIEIILVDDGSTDSSGLICEKFSETYSNVITFHKNNGGLMSAWKYGVTRSKGDFIGFVDSDDWIDTNMFERLLTSISSNDCDIAVCGLIKGEYLVSNSSNYDGKYDVKDIYPTLINNGTFMGRGVIPSRVLKLYKRDIVTKVLEYCNDKVTIGEDMVMNFAAFMEAKNIYFINDFYTYHYRINDASITQKFNTNYIDKVKLFNLELRKISEKNPEYDFKNQIDCDLICNSINVIDQVCSSKLSNKEIVKYIKKILNDDMIVNSLNQVNIKKWDFRYRIYFYGFVYKKYITLLFMGKTIYFMRKIKIRIRKIKRI